MVVSTGSATGASAGAMISVSATASAAPNWSDADDGSALGTRRWARSRIASTMSSSTPSPLAPMQTHATSSLLVTTAVTRAAKPITANTSATISIGRPPATRS